MADQPLDPSIQAMLNALTPEQRAEYKKQGEYLYNSVDYAANGEPKAVPNSDEAIAYIESGLHSGLHVSSLDKDEVQLLRDTFGDKWYERYDYTEDDLILCAQCRRSKSMLSQNEKLQCCSRCKSMWYCSVEHQTSDWAEHKKVCKSFTKKSC
jgi:hypothetical protein